VFALHLNCRPSNVDLLSSQLWEAGTLGIQEVEQLEGVSLIASFETNINRAGLLIQFADYYPQWLSADATDWVAATQRAWPPREIGRRIFLAPPWCTDPTPSGRTRLIHNPGLACGTGEHPCTQLALTALETSSVPGQVIVDVGTGSGLLAIAALQFGAALAIGVDPDESSLAAATENSALNNLRPLLAAASADALRDACSNVTIANISGTVLLSIADDLLRITSSPGQLILTGFTHHELAVIEQTCGRGEVTSCAEWRCLRRQLS
jgi:ribosomal protein L11 methyltransferase